MEVSSEFGRIQTTLPWEKFYLTPTTVPLPTTINPISTLLIRQELIPQIFEIGQYALKQVGAVGII